MWHSMATKELDMEGVELVAVLIVAWCLGYWAAHISLSLRRQAFHEAMKELEAGIALTEAIQADRSRVGKDDKHTAV